MHKAFEYLSKAEGVDTPDVRYAATVKRADSAQATRGVYVRNAAELSAPATYNVTLEPRLHRDADTRTDRLKARARTA